MQRITACLTDDLAAALERLRRPADPVLAWERVRHELLGSN